MAGKELKLYIHKLYEYSYEKFEKGERPFIKPKNKKCPRCGSFMAYHKWPVPRWHCGKCGHTEFIKEKK
ncbi:Ribosomal protein S27a [Pyrolobus fumarii 1A]|uniref:Small ribosomal subunit protein eS31 n=1 Tax=Pyrolobus fumarii (strain DSM 11204 / 1A) TaxID=694429 RepID=G0EDD2_PYRF1|nr:30S ribosomal protein S27ae [Pyrolobus fumarii]AEM38617.1 Ribosomal protein S27a [Pyrolobus fumarii 1A]